MLHSINDSMHIHQKRWSTVTELDGGSVYNSSEITTTLSRQVSV